MKQLFYLNKYIKKYRVKITLGFVFVVLSNLSALLPANLIGKSFDLIIEEINLYTSSSQSKLFETIIVYSVLLILFAILKGVFMYFMRQNIIVVSRHIEYDLKNEIFKQYQKLSPNFYQKNDSGDIINRISEDVSRVRMYLGPAIMYSFNLTTLISLILFRMVYISPFLTMVVILPLPLLSFLIYKVSNKINRKSFDVQKTLSSLTNTVQEAFSGIRLVKSFVNENPLQNDFDQISEKYKSVNIELAKINSVFFPLVLLLVGLSILLTVYVGGNLVLSDKVSIGQVTEFIIYVNMLTWPVTSIGWVTEVIQRASASQERINQFLNEKDFTIFSKNENLKKVVFNNLIHFKNVDYVYPKSNISAVKNLNFEIKKSEKIAFVGNVGSGKTTILKILCGILIPKVGEIYIDDVSFKEIDWFNFRKSISYVSQNVFLFSDTIKNNISLHNPKIGDSKIITLLKKLAIYDEILSFEDGINTHVGEGGITLSGGQKQRIALARALISKPKILILDDALSKVDSDTESKIIDFVLNEFEDSTIILSSNRLSILSTCSNIFVLKSGEIIDSGIAKDLIKKKGEFRNLYLNQSRSK
ncbi:MAG: ABC transporter ATP-binding protein [Bacteroidota bacterium]|nr:ABC transporter ATP-binding protein [Bacteroidota bacterium]